MMDGPVQSSTIRRLSECDPGMTVVFCEVHGGMALRGRLAAIGLVPGVRFRVVQRHGRRHGPVIIMVHGSKLALGYGIAQRVFVEVLT